MNHLDGETGIGPMPGSERWAKGILSGLTVSGRVLMAAFDQVKDIRIESDCFPLCGQLVSSSDYGYD